MALPTSTEDILALGNIDPEFAEVFKEAYTQFSIIGAQSKPPALELPWTISDLKTLCAAGLPNLQTSLHASRPKNILETTTYIPMRDGYMSRTIVLNPNPPSPMTEQASSLPVLVMFHGGGHCVMHPESEIPLFRLLVSKYNMICIAQCYLLAPEHPFPASIHDAWDTLQWVASECTSAATSPSALSLLHHAEPSYGFIVAGSSAGANLSASLAHLARDNDLRPPLTGQFLGIPTVMHHQHVPAKYQGYYLAWEQNKSAPILDRHLYNLFSSAFNPDPTSELWASFNHPNGHVGLPKAYFQVCGMDMFRDDRLIYERVLKEEAGVETRIDLYGGLPHSWWSIFPGLEVSRRREQDSVRGVGWLLGRKEGELKQIQVTQYFKGRLY